MSNSLTEKKLNLFELETLILKDLYGITESDLQEILITF